MIERQLWLDKINNYWQKVPIVWLSGVRRSGKTVIAKYFSDALYLNCDLPSVRKQVDDPEFFFASQIHKRIIFDEIHQLSDPSLVLKIAADEHPEIKILATGSSTLEATKKFSDSLAGRKRTIHLTPVLANEIDLFNINIKDRLLRGGLPIVLLGKEIDEAFYQEWLESFLARDIAELFAVERTDGFVKLVELMMRNNGQLTNHVNLAKYCGLSRQTIMHYLNNLEITHVITKIRPFHQGGKQEILQQPKYYVFDTGFAVFCKGFNNFKESDYGVLLENLTLDTLTSSLNKRNIYFWRNKQQNEIDFIYQKNMEEQIAIECKANGNSFDIKNLRAFRKLYPKGENIVVTMFDKGFYKRKIDNHEIIFTGICSLHEVIKGIMSL